MSTERRPRVANREGRVWQRADGRWTARVWLPDQVGKYRQVYAATRDEAIDKKKSLEREIAEGQPDAVDATVSAYFEHWLGKTLVQRVAAGRLSESTLDSYRDNAAKHVLPGLGAVRLQKLTVSQVRQWQTDLLLKPSGRRRRRLRPGEAKLPAPAKLSPRTVAYCHAILRKALNDALSDDEWGLKRNVAALVDLPDAGDQEIDPPAIEEIGALLEAMSHDKLWCYWLVVLGLGLRRGEALGLRWQDVDLEAGTIRPWESVQRLRGPAVSTGRRSGHLVAKNLKTKKSRAVVGAPDFVLEALREHQKQQRRQRAQAKIWLAADLVFTTSTGTAIEPRNVNRAWVAVCDRAGVRRMRIHDLRHAFGTQLGVEGLHPKVIQTALRHSRMATTEIYVHAVAEMSRDAAKAMDRVFSRARDSVRDRRSS